VVFKPTVKSTEEIYNICVEAKRDKNVIGIITWMHTFRRPNVDQRVKDFTKTFAAFAYPI